MGKPVFVATLLMLSAFAGCIASPEEAARVETASQGPVLDALGAVAVPTGNLTLNSTWFVVPVTVEPAGGLAAFEWAIPAGALVPWGYNEVFDESEQTVVLEIALLGTSAVDTWGLIFFEEGQKGLEVGGGYLSFAATSTFYSATSEQVFESELRTTDFAQLGSDVKEGQLLRGIAIARGAEVKDVAVAFRVLSHDPNYPDSEEEPAASPEMFVADRNGSAPFSLAPRAVAKGFVFNGYVDVIFGGLTPADPMMGIESVFGEPTYAWSVERQMRALGGPQTFEGSIDSELDEGFDVVSSDYFSISHGRATYAAEVTLHGETLAASGTDAELGFIGLVAGLPMAGGGAFALGDGTGASHAKLSVDRVLVGGLFAVTEVGLLELGANVETLFGTPAMADAEVGDNGALLPGTILTPRGLIHVGSGGAMWTYALPGYESLQKL